MHRSRLALLCMAVAVVPAAIAAGGSIWQRGSARSRSLYSDDTARSPGDVLTIIIEEHSRIQNSSERKLEKKTNRNAAASGRLQVRDFLPALYDESFVFPELEYNSSSDNKLDGKADYDKDRRVTDKITVTVEDVLPNGYLVVLGKRRRVIDGDLQMIQASGIVRPSDVSFSNEVSSNRVADFYVVYSGQGEENKFTHPGWLARFMNLISPF